ncbi:MAG: hypothetical protein ACKPEY_15835 [Planctomycetota bacterium]
MNGTSPSRLWKRLPRCSKPLILLASLGLFTATGCYSPESSRVPAWRGIPASLLSKNSREAEVYRQQRTGYIEGWPVPDQPVVGPLSSLDAGIAGRRPVTPEESSTDTE